MTSFLVCKSKLWMKAWFLVPGTCCGCIFSLQIHARPPYKGQNSWMGQPFVALFGASNFPNSGHDLVCHVPDYLDQFMGFAKFSQQGFEKIIEELKSSSRACQSPLLEIPMELLQENNRRLPFLETEFEMKRIKDVCSLCKVPGHRVSNKNCPSHKEYLEERKKMNWKQLKVMKHIRGTHLFVIVWDRQR